MSEWLDKETELHWEMTRAVLMQCFPVVCRLAVTQAACAEGVVTLRDGAQAEMAAGIVRGRFLAGAASAGSVPSTYGTASLLT